MPEHAPSIQRPGHSARAARLASTGSPTAPIPMRCENQSGVVRQVTVAAGSTAMESFALTGGLAPRAPSCFRSPGSSATMVTPTIATAAEQIRGPLNRHPEPRRPRGHRVGVQREFGVRWGRCGVLHPTPAGVPATFKQPQAPRCSTFRANTSAGVVGTNLCPPGGSVNGRPARATAAHGLLASGLETLVTTPHLLR